MLCVFCMHALSREQFHICMLLHGAGMRHRRRFERPPCGPQTPHSAPLLADFVQHTDKIILYCTENCRTARRARRPNSNGLLQRSFCAIMRQGRHRQQLYVAHQPQQQHRCGSLWVVSTQRRAACIALSCASGFLAACRLQPQHRCAAGLAVAARRSAAMQASAARRLEPQIGGEAEPLVERRTVDIGQLKR